MTQYKSKVEYQRKKLAAIEWGERVSYLMAQDGYLETKLNNGSVTREYRDGNVEVLQEAMSVDQLIIEAPSGELENIIQAGKIY